MSLPGALIWLRRIRRKRISFHSATLRLVTGISYLCLLALILGASTDSNYLTFGVPFAEHYGVGGFLNFGAPQSDFNIDPSSYTHLGFACCNADGTVFVSIPYWPFIVLAALLPLWHLAAVVGLRKRPDPGPPLCEVCGYDLRASPHRCPECGTPVPVTTADAPTA